MDEVIESMFSLFSCWTSPEFNRTRRSKSLDESRKYQRRRRSRSKRRRLLINATLDSDSTKSFEQRVSMRKFSEDTTYRSRNRSWSRNRRVAPNTSRSMNTRNIDFHRQQVAKEKRVQLLVKTLPIPATMQDAATSKGLTKPTNANQHHKKTWLSAWKVGHESFRKRGKATNKDTRGSSEATRITQCSVDSQQETKMNGKNDMVMRRNVFRNPATKMRLFKKFRSIESRN